MNPHRWRPALTVLALALAAAAPPAAQPPDDVAALAGRIDQLVAAGYADHNAVPAPPADDAEFLRRVWLDLAGRIPRVAEVHAFLEDRAPDKRRRLVDRLLAGPHYARHFANVWRALLLPQANNPQLQQLLGPQLEAWARRRLRDNQPLDRIVRELLTASLAPGAGAPDPAALAFYQANEFKPENLAASTSRLFLGVKLGCAQCHDHPFAPWRRQQFWEFAAFFAGVQPLQPEAGAFSAVREVADRRDLPIPNTQKTVRAHFLDGREPAWKADVSTRATLAGWLTGPDNPYFARAAANRLWAHFFGLGLVDPVDEVGDDNPPSHPELLDELAGQLAGHRFDAQFLIRAITASRTYQLASTQSHPSQEDPRLFARMPLKGLTPEQLFDSLAVATGSRQSQPGPASAEFLAKFASAGDRRTEQPTSILQALALMNGPFVADATSLDRGETLAALLDAPFLDERQKLDALFLASLSRPMRPAEASRLVNYVARGGPGGNPKKALADVFWALLNSSEFFLNH
jgi:hypothetical protein